MQKEVIKVNDKQVLAVEWNGERVITTAQLAEVYGASVDNVRVNFNNNKEHFKANKHYFLLKGEDLQIFKRNVNDIYVVKPNINQLYLWTKRGASRHCKILDTERAWEQFDCLEENYFNQHPVSPAVLESVTNAGCLLEQIMKSEGASPCEIAIAVRSLFQQAGIDVPDCVVKVPAYEQLTLILLQGRRWLT